MGIMLTLDTIAGGRPIDAFVDMCRVATALRIWVKASVNGIEVMVAPDDRPNVIDQNWQKARERGATFVSANVIPIGDGQSQQEKS